MKKKLLCIAFGLLALGIFSLSAQEGGYTGPSVKVTTVEDAKTLRDDSPVILRGKIEQFIGDEKYTFTDETGSITIEIDKKRWGSLTVNETDRVEISGEIDRDGKKTEIEVETIKKL
jgi:uncharacterized protein (TIGR00156 family)